MNTFNYTNRAINRLVGSVVMLAMLLGVFVAPLSTAYANSDWQNNELAKPHLSKYLCHYTSGDEQSFEKVTLWQILSQWDKSSSRHHEHENDIIPKRQLGFLEKMLLKQVAPHLVDLLESGRNLDTNYNGQTGQEVLDDNCAVPEPIPTNDDGVTIIATKIVCEDEAALPNWGAGGSAINGSTASIWLSNYDGDDCDTAEDYQFQWALGGVDIRDDNSGALGDPWQTTGATNGNGQVTVVIDEDTLANSGVVSVREVLKPGYQEFTGRDSDNDVSAEIYCTGDAANYDNLEWINVQAGGTYHCVAWNVPPAGDVGGGDPVPEPCVDNSDRDWAHEVVAFKQGTIKDGGPVVNPNRIDEEVVLGPSTWTHGNEAGFFSLGFGGWIELEFDAYVLNVAGHDLEIHEATNNAWPLERAEVYVSQDGSDWRLAGIANNTAGDRISDIDFGTTGLAWIQYVRIVDATDFAIHTDAVADGFDLAAVKAVSVDCDRPEPEPPVEPCNLVIFSDETNTVDEKDGAFAKLVTAPHHVDWMAIVTAPAKWIWGDNPVVDPVATTTQTFAKTFNWTGPVTSMELELASDNSHKVFLNGTEVASSSLEKNFLTSLTYNLATGTIQEGTNTLSIEVTNWAQAGGTTESNPAGLNYHFTITGTDADCGSVPEPEPEPETATIVATKIICPAETMLPNWGDNGPDITANTATAFLAQNPSCYLADWQFEWAAQQLSIEDEWDGKDNVVGTLGDAWTNNGVATATGTVRMTVPLVALGDDNLLTVREIMQPDFLPFSGRNITDAVSAEFYCHNDVLNFDNFEWLEVENGQTYHCVAWNVPIADNGGDPTDPGDPAPVCEADTNLIKNSSFEAPVVTHSAGWNIFASGTALLEWIADWVNPDVNAPDTASLELHRGVIGLAAEGNQYAELDTDWYGPDNAQTGEPASVAIAQTVDTIIGEEYEIGWAFSARPDTGAEDNVLEVLVANVVVASSTAAGGTANEWTYASTTFTATASSTTVTFRDAGTPNSQGTFLDDVSLTCLPQSDDTDPGNGNNDLRYTLSIEITGDGDGDVEFDGVGGDSTLTCNRSEDDSVVCVETYLAGTVVDLAALADEDSNFNNSWTVGAGTCTGNQTPCQVTMNSDINLVAHFDLNSDNPSPTRTSARGGGGSRVLGATATNDDFGLGGADTTLPGGQVLGEQVSIVPVGGANAGAGGAAATSISLAFFGAAVRRINVRTR